METRKYRHLCESERYMIVTGLQAGHSFRKIGRLLGRSASSISREFGRNKTGQGYDALLAHQQAKAKRRKPRIVKKLNAHRHLRSYVMNKLDRLWSPQQISGRLIKDFPDAKEMRISHETIYAFIYAMPKSGLRAELIANLRRKHPHRYKHGRDPNKQKARISDMVSIPQERLDEISHLLNTRPRKSLDYQTPREVYMKEFKQYRAIY